MRWSKWNTGTMAAIALLAGLFFILGCGDNPAKPVSDDIVTGNYDTKDDDIGSLQYVIDNYGDPGEWDLSGQDPEGDVLAKHFRFKEDGDTATIGPDGGTLELKMRGFKSKLKIEKNALSENVLISAEGLLISTHCGDLLLYDFGPDGLVFNVPCELEVDAGRLLDHEILRLFWWNPATGEWEFQQEVEVSGHKIKFDLHHFSKYAIS